LCIGQNRPFTVHFRPGVYDPTTVDGLAQLAHELVHVGQYRNGMTRSVLAMGLS